MPTRAAVETPTPENVHLYRAAVLAWRSAWREEIGPHEDQKSSPIRIFRFHAAALAVQELAPEMTLDQARTFAQKAAAWAAQAHHKWFWSGIPGSAYR